MILYSKNTQYIMNHISREKEYICYRHKMYTLANIYPLSPCRSICAECKNKRVHGYTNPNHGSNPFGYCYLCPVICISCADKGKKCMWCELQKKITK